MCFANNTQYSHDGQFFAVMLDAGHIDYKVGIYSTSTLACKSTIELADAAYHNVVIAWSRNSQNIVMVQHDRNKTSAYDIDSEEEVVEDWVPYVKVACVQSGFITSSQALTPDLVHCQGLSPYGQYAVVGWHSNHRGRLIATAKPEGLLDLATWDVHWAADESSFVFFDKDKHAVHGVSVPSCAPSFACSLEAEGLNLKSLQAWVPAPSLLFCHAQDLSGGGNPVTGLAPLIMHVPSHQVVLLGSDNCSVAPDGHCMAINTCRNSLSSVFLLEVSTGQVRCVIEVAHSGKQASYVGRSISAWSPNSRWLAVLFPLSDTPLTMHMMDAASWQQSASIPLKAKIAKMVWSPDSCSIALQGREDPEGYDTEFRELFIWYFAK